MEPDNLNEASNNLSVTPSPKGCSDGGELPPNCTSHISSREPAQKDAQLMVAEAAQRLHPVSQLAFALSFLLREGTKAVFDPKQGQDVDEMDAHELIGVPQLPLFQ